jgi:serine-type D-Ala-D-Ala endopeptidase (penicillin-binding protein 7)
MPGSCRHRRACYRSIMVGRIAVLVGLLQALPAVLEAPVPQAHAKKRRKGRGRPAPPVPALTPDGWPNVKAPSAVVIDLDAGEELYHKNPDEVRPIASVGKIFVALAVRAHKLDLAGATAILPEDRQFARGGSKSRLHEGKSFQNHDLLRAMLIGSDNRAVTAVGRAAGLTPDKLVAAMNAEARKLGLKKTSFTDPTGLNGNVSTTREVAVALRAALEDPVLAAIMGSHEAIVRSVSHPGYSVWYANTNHVLRANRYPVIGGKTGYTDEARYCLAVASKLDNRRVGMVFLGAEGELTRFADFNRVAEWIVSGAPTRMRPQTGGAVGAALEPPPQAMTPRLKAP